MVKINFGAGDFKLDGWINVDLNPDHRPTLIADLSQALPFRDSCADYIHSEDFIDQLELDLACRFFLECYRLLKPKGVMRILTPDLFRFAKLYVDRDQQLATLWKKYVRLPLQVDTLGEIFNRGMRLGGHTFLYDHETLVKVLGRCGFRAERVNYRQSRESALRGLDRRSPDTAVSMYFDCYKIGISE
jgi:predicted SAM-dependent methyltransferase